MNAETHFQGFPDPTETEEKALHECGWVVLYSPQMREVNSDLLPRGYAAISSLQNRGEHGAGVATTSRFQSRRVIGRGKLTEALPESALTHLPNRANAIMFHNRWATFGDVDDLNTQPTEVYDESGMPIYMCINGNTPGAGRLRIPHVPAHASDTVIMANKMVNYPGTLDEQILQLFSEYEVEGSAYSGAILAGDTLYIARDPSEVHPLVLGQLVDENGKMLVAASEDCALDQIGAQAVGYVQGGDILKITPDGTTLLKDGTEQRDPRRCIFEHTYFMRAYSHIEQAQTDPNEWHTIGQRRHHLGIEMAREHQDLLSRLDYISDIPDSGRYFATGIATGHPTLPYLPIIHRTKDTRSFIQGMNADETMRKILEKFTFMREPSWLVGKRIALADDSLIQGNTSRVINRILRGLGVAEIHWFLSLPMVKKGCHLGVNLKPEDQMIANKYLDAMGNTDVMAIAADIEADSVNFATHEMMIRAARPQGDLKIPRDYDPNYPHELYWENELCGGCVTGVHFVDSNGNRTARRSNTINLYLPS